MISNAPVCDKVTRPDDKIDAKYDAAEGKAEKKSINASYDKKVKQDLNKNTKWSSGQKATPIFQP